jgi:hypothetical protein
MSSEKNEKLHTIILKTSLNQLLQNAFYTVEECLEDSIVVAVCFGNWGK